ncbi:50S ribosomal protein L6 [Methanohalophilus sp. WG1-DM]|jgi:large subunit ribosomal protein L6|uniref:50S ribosomal protein L6 n=1 Tax=Methanohalophilus sp. WG1-DM TaxID=2491675 RepID=UPI000FFF2B3C|nr:50S ribosomal protein L6 [Methanohalophilus sp. WG1-DM]RXG34608.1 large subunit ribosomal protein L6 [Methanohalophilus sp. WG1-DM]
MVNETKKAIPIPEGVTVSYENKVFTASGEKGTNTKRLWYPGITITVDESEVTVDCQSVRKRQKAMVGTFASHISNLMDGVVNGFEYKMKVVYSHFPMQLKVEGDKLLINNFLGEKRARVSRIIGETNVKTSSDEVTITGINREDVGQTASNMEQITRIKAFDPRVFQDGLYLIEKS